MSDLSRMRKLAGLTESFDLDAVDAMADSIGDFDVPDTGAHGATDVAQTTASQELYSNIKAIASRHGVRDINGFMHEIAVLISPHR